MRLKLFPALLVAAALTTPLTALHVKVVSVDHGARHIKVLLPMHHATVEASLMPEEAEIRVRPNHFYEAELDAGEVNTTKPNVLRIKIPDGKPVKFRLRKISFLR